MPSILSRLCTVDLLRVVIPERKRYPAFIIIDEAVDYFDDNMEDLLRSVRKFRLGVVFAAQNIDQMSPTLGASVAANTSVKLTGEVSDRDARLLAPIADLRVRSMRGKNSQYSFSLNQAHLMSKRLSPVRRASASAYTVSCAIGLFVRASGL